MPVTKNLISVSLEKHRETISTTLNPSILVDSLTTNLKKQHNRYLIIWGEHFSRA